MSLRDWSICRWKHKPCTLKVRDWEFAAAKASTDVGSVLIRPVEALSSLDDESSADDKLEVSTEDVTSQKGVSTVVSGPSEELAIVVVGRAVVVGGFMDAAEFMPPVGFGTGFVLISCLASVRSTGPIGAGAMIEVEGKIGSRSEALSTDCDSMSTLGEILLRKRKRKRSRSLRPGCVAIDFEAELAVAAACFCLGVVFETRSYQ